MDFRTAMTFLSDHFPTTPTRSLMGIADALVLETTPLSPDSAAKRVFNPDFHPDHKIHFIKAVREATGCSLVDAKRASEKVLSDHSIAELRDKLVGRPEEDEDGSLAYAKMLERRSEDAWTPDDEEPF